MIEHFLPISVKGDKRFMRKFDSTVKYYFRGGLVSLYPDRLRNAVNFKRKCCIILPKKQTMTVYHILQNVWKFLHYLSQAVVLHVKLIFSYLYSTQCFCILGFAVLGVIILAHLATIAKTPLRWKENNNMQYIDAGKKLNIHTDETSLL